MLAALSVALPFPVPVAPFVVQMFPVPVVPSVGSRSLGLAVLSVAPVFPVPVVPSVGPRSLWLAALSVALPFLVQKSLEDWFLVLESAVAPFQESESTVLLSLWSDSLSWLSPVQQD